MTNVVVAILLEKYLDATSKDDADDELDELEFDQAKQLAAPQPGTQIEEWNDSPTGKKTSKRNSKRSRRASVDMQQAAIHVEQSENFRSLQMQLNQMNNMQLQQQELIRKLSSQLEALHQHIAPSSLSAIREAEEVGS